MEILLIFLPIIFLSNIFLSCRSWVEPMLTCPLLPLFFSDTPARLRLATGC